jgi:hypothetical protein
MTASELDVVGTSPTSRVLLIPVVVGTGVAVGLGVYGAAHDPTGYAVNVAGFSNGLAVKAWLTTLAAALAFVQVLTALEMWGRLGFEDRNWIVPLHRWSGRLAVLVTLPVVTHCLYALGFDHSTPRSLLHSVVGCFFFGAFATKMLALSRPNLPAGALPLLGGLVFTGLVVLWLTSSLWFFTTFGVTT